MSDSKEKSCSDVLKCPLCEGRGELPKQLLMDRLSEKDLGRKVESFMSIVDSEQKETLHGVTGTPPSKAVTSWNLTHFLWRRSPKE